MLKKFTASAVLSLLLLNACKQKQEKEGCSTIRNGKFYFYPTFSKGAFTIIRLDSMQQEIDHTTGDTSLWSVKWLDDCNYQLQYQKGISSLSEKAAEAVRQRIVYVRILDVSKDYYRIKINGGTLPQKGEIDTIWRKEK